MSEIGDADLPTLGTLEALLRGEKLRPRWRAVRELSITEPADAVRTSDHLVRLWARDQIVRSLNEGSSRIESAQELGIRHQLVTPVTGAVVLETAAQYKANNLEPVNPDTVPTIPEPATWLLALVLMGMIFWLRRQNRDSCAA
ncbi:MAG: PEP-CTERM sorting domain-containing protein [Kiritimatiellia bacterium]